MKKHLKLIVPIIVIIIAVSLIFAVYLAMEANKTPVGIIDNVYYDMTPDDLKKVLGEPQSIKDNMDLSEEIDYSYTVDINGVPTEMSFSFLDGKKLIAVYAHVDADNLTDADEIFGNWKSQLYEEYKDDKGFFCDEIQKNSDTDYEIELGTHLGAVGVYCTVSVKENVVRLSCINMK